MVNATIMLSIDISVYGMAREDFEELSSKMASMIEDYIENVLFDYDMMDYDLYIESSTMESDEDE